MSPGIDAESDLSGNLKSEYVFFDGERVARKDFPGNSVFYYFSDHLKTASVITDSAGTIKEDEDYYPWGGELQFVNNDSNHYKFTSKERDSETGLDYFGARYYSNALARFVSADWSANPEPVPYANFENPQTLTLYHYPSNPETFADKDGHQQSLDAQRRAAVRDAWKQERANVAAGKPGSVNWTAAQKAELLQTGRVSGFEGHHINSVNGNPQLARDPNNIKFVEGRAGNLAEHGGNFRNPTRGGLMNRTLLGVQALQLLTSAFSAYMEQRSSGIAAGNPLWSPDLLTIVDPAKAANTLNGTTIWLGDGNQSTAGIHVRDGKYYKFGCEKDCEINPNQLKGKKFTFRYVGFL